MSISVPILGTAAAAEPTDQQKAIFEARSAAVSSLYVLREQRFYNVTRPNEPMSRRDVEQAFLNQPPALTPNTQVTAEVLKKVFSHCIDIKHTDRAKSVPVSGGEVACFPGNPERSIWLPTGTVSINSWVQPDNR